MSSAFSQRPPFDRGWSPALIRNKTFELAELVAEYSEFHIQITINSDLYHKMVGSLLPKQSAFCNPYSILAYHLIMSVSHWTENGEIDGHVDFIFDEQGEVGRKAFAMWDRIKSYSEDGGPEIRGDAPISRSDTRVLPLQAADMIAWEVRQSTLGNSHEQLSPLRRINCFQTLVTVESMQKLRDSILQWSMERERNAATSHF
jgi:hypothetical protein